MTRIAIGIAAEYAADNIAANSLWPATAIESQTTHQLAARKDRHAAISGVRPRSSAMR